ncbi:hypothetical protein [Micromonospora cathayae]|uniref:Uncharacterized protein n=1 Tax=Micromonospora cathayae TaxID=3028804 RepID=A0ABY7ZIZ9_9ACTN|nr:hypothetical protein [Micromonospora sp. HUAS 3]WDZ82930.1 hypothetical protein PVK37_20935 [Micromonospora sp. HUAS 3]
MRIALRATVRGHEGRHPAPDLLDERAAQLMEKLLELEHEDEGICNSSVSVDQKEGTLTVETILESSDGFPVAEKFVFLVQQAEDLELAPGASRKHDYGVEMARS